MTVSTTYSRPVLIYIVFHLLLSHAHRWEHREEEPERDLNIGKLFQEVKYGDSLVHYFCVALFCVFLEGIFRGLFFRRLCQGKDVL